jgi:DNA-binding transcriptional ArsR family regulator
LDTDRGVQWGENVSCYDGVDFKVSTTVAKKTDKDSDALQAEVFERQARICKAFANSTRLRMLDLLGKRDWPASELQEHLGISKANLSQHVAILKAAGVVASRRHGKAVFFSLTMPEVKSACQLIRDVLRAQIRDGRRLSV